MFFLLRRIALGFLLAVFSTPIPAGESFARNTQLRATPTLHARPDRTLRPWRGYSPGEVIRLLLKALAHNDSPHKDAGIQTVYRFASPANKRVTGPLAHFSWMLHGRTYGPMLDHLAVEYGPLNVSAGRARQPVILTTDAGRRIGYIFELSRQLAPPFEGMWMTDGVVPVKVPQDLRQA